MSIMKKAQDLAEAIVESTEYDELKAAEEAMNADKDAQEVLQEFQASQKKAQMAQMNGQQVTEEMQKELQGLQAKMQQNEKIKSFMESQQKFNKIMQTVNQVISSALQGEESCDSEGCSQGCC